MNKKYDIGNRFSLRAFRLVSLPALLLFALCLLLAYPAYSAEKLQVLDGSIKVVSDNYKFTFYESDVPISDAWFNLSNATAVPGTFSPILYFKSNKTNPTYANSIVADCTEDEVGMGPVFSFMARANNTTVVNRDLFWFDNYFNNPAMVIKANGNVGLGTNTPSYPLQMKSGAYVSAGGAWTDASSREYKENISDLSSEDAMLAFNKLNPVIFNYKIASDEKHVGFIAEDVPDLLATKDRKGLSTMDIVAVLTKIVQEQQKTIADLKEKMNKLEQEIK